MQNQPIGRVMLKNARGAFLNVFEPSTVNGEGDPRYGATAIIEPDHPQLAEIRKAIDAVAKEKWKDKAQGILQGLYKTGKVALHEGDEKPNYEGFPGNYYVSASAKQTARPGVFGPDRSPLIETDGRIYSGAYYNFSLEFWAQDNGYGKRINCTLRGLQFMRDGESFGGTRPADSDEFEEEVAGADDFA
jgi:hypothetical protein